jgi:ribosomal protein L11 methyltransferase
MWSVLFEVDEEGRDLLAAELWEAGTCGMVEEADSLLAFFEDGAAAKALALGHDRATIEQVSEEAPAYRAPEGNVWEPVLAGERFVIVPPGTQRPAYDGRWRLEIDAAAAFGTGRHESTQLSIEALERHLKPGQDVVDVGCGSGILSAAASLLGAGRVVSCDIDPEALRVARRHVETPLFAGSVDALKCGSIDVLLVNISAVVVDRLAPGLKRVAKPGAIVVLAGFIKERVPQCFEAFEVLERGGWLCWVCRAEGIRTTPEQVEANDHAVDWWR